MPLLRHAKKKLKQDKKRTAQNRKVKAVFRDLIKKAKAEKTLDAVSSAFSSVDKAAKKNIIPKNRAARLKSSLSKVLDGKAVQSTVKAKPKTKAQIKIAKKKAVVAKNSKKKTSTSKK